eukprot:1056965-Prymnesium_polylepis.2
MVREWVFRPVNKECILFKVRVKITALDVLRCRADVEDERYRAATANVAVNDLEILDGTAGSVVAAAASANAMADAATYQVGGFLAIVAGEWATECREVYPVAELLGDERFKVALTNVGTKIIPAAHLRRAAPNPFRCSSRLT